MLLANRCVAKRLVRGPDPEPPAGGEVQDVSGGEVLILNSSRMLLVLTD